MKKKIFMAYKSATGPYALNAMISRAFESIGWSIIPLNCMLLEKEQLQYKVDKYKNEVDFYLEIGRGCLPVSIIKKLKIPTINWMPTIITDSRNTLKIVKEKLIYFDKVYTSTQYEIPLYKKCGVTAYLLLIGACPEFCENKNLEKGYQIGMLGNMEYPGRIHLSNLIRTKYPMYLGYSYHKYIELINQIKININLGLFPFCLPRRMFEIMACGGFLMNHEIQGENVFEDGKHYVSYNEYNVLRKLEYYLTHDEERKRIAKQGQEFVLKNHTFKHRVLKIIEDVKYG